MVRRALALLRQSPGALITLAAMFAGVLPFLFYITFARTTMMTLALGLINNPHPFQGLLLLPLTAALTLIFQAMVVHLTTSGERGWALGPSLRTALRVFFPNLGLYALSHFAIGTASLLVLVPGFMLACRWMVAIPAEVAERVGVFGALARSRDLTRGCRWRIFGLMLILYAIVLVLFGGQFLLARALIGSGVSPLALSLVTVVVGPITGLSNTLGVTAIYLELRRVKEGGLLGEIASVFE